MNTVAGHYLHFGLGGQFVYAYQCPQCGRTFKSTSPELSAPSICHRCFTGRRIGRVKDANKRRERQA